MANTFKDKRIVDFLRCTIQKEDELYSEPVFNLFSRVYYSALDSEDYSEELRRVLRNYILSVYSKFYDRLEHYLDSFYSVVIKERYGLNKEGKSKTYKEISKTLGVDLNKVIRREKYSLEKLTELSKCVEIEGRVFDKEEYEQYKLETEGETLLKATECDISCITGNVLGLELQNQENVYNMIEFREFILRKFDDKVVTEEDLIELFRSYKGCGTKTAIKVIENVRSYGFWKFLTMEEYR